MTFFSAQFESLIFAWPWFAVLLAMPLLARQLAPAADNGRDAALRWPGGIDDAPNAVIRAGKTGGHWFRLLLSLFAWSLLVIAVMRPQMPAGAASAPVTGRNLMLAVDLSGSMNDKDFVLAGRSVERLTATKAVGGDFIERREGDRLGLILFGERAYMQAPLTFDRSTVKTLLYEAMIGFAGQKTAIGDAIALAVKRAREAESHSPGEQQVLILMTDGANTAGEIEPLKAAELAATVGLKIYTIGIGSDRSRGRLRIGPALSSGLDEKNLEAIADMTGGRYFRARDTAGLAEIYLELDQLEPAANEETGFRPMDELFYIPAGAGFTIFGLLGLASLFRGRSV